MSSVAGPQNRRRLEETKTMVALYAVATLFASPLVPVLFLLRERRRKKRGLTPYLNLLAFMSTPGRRVAVILAFAGAEIVAAEEIASGYFGAVDEHIPAILAVLVGIAVAGFVLADQLVLAAAWWARGRRIPAS
jgi:hypothetical protein